MRKTGFKNLRPESASIMHAASSSILCRPPPTIQPPTDCPDCQYMCMCTSTKLREQKCYKLYVRLGVFLGRSQALVSGFVINKNKCKPLLNTTINVFGSARKLRLPSRFMRAAASIGAVQVYVPILLVILAQIRWRRIHSYRMGRATVRTTTNTVNSLSL